MMQKHFDMIIVGGGLVGHCLAKALAEHPISIAIVEAVPTVKQTGFDYDARSIALSYGSKQIFELWDVWNQLNLHATPIQQVHVSDQGHFGFSRIDAKKMQVPALGYVIEMQHLLCSLIDAVLPYDNITRICPATVSEIKQQQDKWVVTIEKDNIKTDFVTSLVVAADGGNSALRQWAGLEAKEWDYEQCAVIANVSLQKPHLQVAYERFTQNGPMAMLPMSHQRSALVWSIKRNEVDDILQLSDSEFLKRLQKQFGYRLGKLTEVGKRFSYPLKAHYVRQQTREGFVLLGNSAHTLHPIAGQGFNLCLRDVKVLADTLSKAIEEKQSIGQMAVLDRYFQLRKSDQMVLFRYCDSLVRLFSTQFLPIVYLRNIGMLSMDLFPYGKNTLAQMNMGLIG